ncbi:MAG: hypothetical protein ACUVS7_16065 [Bryobacteraceae bacterium]
MPQTCLDFDDIPAGPDQWEQDVRKKIAVSREPHPGAKTQGIFLAIMDGPDMAAYGGPMGDTPEDVEIALGLTKVPDFLPGAVPDLNLRDRTAAGLLATAQTAADTLQEFRSCHCLCDVGNSIKATVACMRRRFA